MPGNLAGALRVGDTVRRRTGEWSPAVHVLLAFLEEQGFDGSPRLLGRDEDGREILSFVAGDPPSDTRLAATPDSALLDTSRLLRRLHDVTEPLARRSGIPWVHPAATDGPELVVCHNDIAPRNTVYRDGAAVAFIDWDLARPEVRTWDLAHLVWQFCPLADAEGCRGRGFAEPPDRIGRLAALVDAYAPTPAERAGFFPLVVSRVRTTRDGILALAGAGRAEFAHLVRIGVVDGLDRQLRWILEHEEPIRAAVSRRR
jgi:Phosphotransferase enzyme family